MKQSQSKEMTERIWRELSGRLHQFIRSRVNSAADADDILQTVFLRIHQRLDDLRQTERLESWVFQITRNAVSDHFRKRRDVQHDVASLATAAELPGDENLNAEVAGCIAALIDQLPEDQKRAVSMYELEGVPQKEIADRESISVSGAKSRIQRGRQTLETILKDCCNFHFDMRGNVMQFEPTGNHCSGDRECGHADDC